MKCISFCLYGSQPFYCEGALQNADIALGMFPDWRCRFYCDSSVPYHYIDALKAKSNVDVVVYPELWNDDRGMFVRFFPADETDVEYMISRDTDSRLSIREKIAIDEWIASGADIHVMRDHPWHGVPMPGGMWGCKGNRIVGMKQAIERLLTERASRTIGRSYDQGFLAHHVWYKFVTTGQLSAIVHDSFNKTFGDIPCKPFPFGAPRGDTNGGVFFVGEKISIKGTADNLHHRKMRETEKECW